MSCSTPPDLADLVIQSGNEQWALGLARLMDRQHELPADTESLLEALGLLGHESFRDGQLEVVLAALRGDSMQVVRPTGSGKRPAFTYRDPYNRARRTWSLLSGP